METTTVAMPQSKKIITITVVRKNIKTCRLKVFPDERVVLSLPLNTSPEWIEQFLNEKSKWIEKKLEVFRETAGYAATDTITHGMSVTILGRECIVIVNKGDADSIYLMDQKIIIEVKDNQDNGRITFLFESWWRQKCERLFKEYLDRMFPIVRKYNVSKPGIAIRKMRTLWGSCSPKRKMITLNFNLMKARPTCIEYVMLHELTHLIYPNHSKAFYDFISISMPDWKERKRILDYDVVHGL